MAWTAPYTWTTGELVNAAKLNEQLRDNMNVLNPGGATLVLDNAGAVFTAGSGSSSGSVLAFEMPMSVCLQTMTLITPEGASVLQLDFWKAPFANWPPGSQNSIVGSSPLTASGTCAVQMTSLSTWSPSLAQGDWVVPRILAATGITKALIGIRWNRI